MNNAKKAFELYKEEIMCNINNYCSDAYPYSYNTIYYVGFAIYCRLCILGIAWEI